MHSILRVRLFLTAFGLLLMPISAALGQQVTGTQAGIIDYLQGNVFLDNAELLLCGGCFVQMENGQHLHTEHGRVEVLLAANITLWLDENSSLQMDQTV